ncbi:MAG: dihydropteroate synthase [Bryobacterales bacterium]|nr:dihydropteroate synthase [Acidobacteriota bacterium]MCB9384302.1 dihydropteroate synthase [Bryobacterales bacterium]
MSAPRQRTRHLWKIRDGEVPLGAQTLLLGVLDLGVDGARPEGEASLARAEELVDEGAAMIDVTALPGPSRSVRIDADHELRRLVPTVRKLAAHLDVPFSVATYNSETAARVIELGVSVINDPTGLALDPEMPKTVGVSDVGVILAHAFGGPETWSKGRPLARLFEMIRSDLDSAVARSRRGGASDRRRIVVDPGLGLGKKGPQNWQVLERLDELAVLGQPVMVSASGKPFLTETVRAPEMESILGEAIAVAQAVRGGAHIVRTEHVKEMRAAAATADRLLEALEALG